MEQKIFLNQQVDLSVLPSVDDLHYTGLEPKYKFILQLIVVIVTSIIFIGLSTLFFFGDPPLWIALTILAAWILISTLIFAFVSKIFKYKGYAVRTRDLVYKKGWLYKKQITVPFSRIQHVDIKQGVLERRYKLGTLNLYTAGGQSSDLTIPGLKIEDAKRFKSFILGVMESDEEE